MRLKIKPYVVLAVCGVIVLGGVALHLPKAAQETKAAEETTAAGEILATEGTNACGQTMTTDMKAQRALDIQEIQNVAGLHEYYHSALMHKEEYENIWSERDDISWTNNSDKYIGREDFYDFYVNGCPTGDEKTGVLWYHMLTSPVIVVSGDGQTAKGVWQSFGNVTGADGTAQWTEEKYGIDFIKENGEWKIWHLSTYVEFYTNIDSDMLWVTQNMAAPAGASNGQGGFTTPAEQAQQNTQQDAQQTPSGDSSQAAPDGTPPGPPPGGDDSNAPAGGTTMSQPTETGDYYEGYSENYEPTLNPVPPEDYCTWEDTWSY